MHTHRLRTRRYRAHTNAACNDASEVVREELRLRKEQHEVRLRWREQIERGEQEAQAGRLVDGDEAFRRGS